jgi:hypothetical protein
MNRTVCVGDIGPSSRESHSIFTTISSLLQAPRAGFVYRYPNGLRLQAKEIANVGFAGLPPQLPTSNRDKIECLAAPLFAGRLKSWKSRSELIFRERFMMDMTTMSAGMTVAMVLVCVIILAFLVLGIAASIKYLRS